MEAIRLIDAAQLKKDRGGFAPGDTVKVAVKAVEGGKERLQAFEGGVIRKRGGGAGASCRGRGGGGGRRGRGGGARGAVGGDPGPGGPHGGGGGQEAGGARRTGAALRP